MIYTLFLPDSPLAGVAQDSDSHTGDTAANAAQEAGILPASLRRYQAILDFSRCSGTGGT